MYGAEIARFVTLMSVPSPIAPVSGGFGLPGLTPKAWSVWGIGWGHYQKPTAGPLTGHLGPGLCPRCWWGFEHLRGPLASGCIFPQSLGKKLAVHPLKREQSLWMCLEPAHLAVPKASSLPLGFAGMRQLQWQQAERFGAN